MYVRYVEEVKQRAPRLKLSYFEKTTTARQKGIASYVIANWRQHAAPRTQLSSFFPTSFAAALALSLLLARSPKEWTTPLFLALAIVNVDKSSNLPAFSPIMNNGIISISG